MKYPRISLRAATISLALALLLSGCPGKSSDIIRTSNGQQSVGNSDISADSSAGSLEFGAASDSAIKDFTDINSDKVTLIAMGNSDVPVGKYSEELLENLDIWDAVRSKVSFCGNVKEILSQVSTGSVDCGIVYATDAVGEPSVTVVSVAPSDLLTTPVVYPAAVLSETPHREASDAFMNFLLTDTSKIVFEKIGFSYIDDPENAPIANTPNGTLIIFAAASLTDALEQIADLFRQEYPDVEVILNFDSSGTLKKQIESGAEADIFFSAAQSPMTELIEGGYIDEASKTDILENEICLIIPVS